MGPGGGSVAGGIVLLVYVVASGLCVAARGAASSPGDRRAWAGIAFVLALLAIEKAVHLEALLIYCAGRTASADGWYVARRGVQIDAIEVLVAIGALLALALAWLLRHARPATRIAAVMTMLLAVFVSIRAVSLHQLDRLLGHGIGPLRVSNVVELAALCVIGGAAWSVRRAHLRGG